MMLGRIRKRWFWIASALVIFVGVVVLRSALVTFIIEPIAWLIWAGWRLLASVDRSVCWVLLVILCSVLLLRLIPLPAGPDDEQSARPPAGSPSASRLGHWEAVAASAKRGHEGTIVVLSTLRNLAGTVAEVTRKPPPVSPRQGRHRRIISLARLLPGYRRRLDQRKIDELLAWMESALEITHEH